MALNRVLLLSVSLGSISCGMVYDFDGYQGLPDGGPCAGADFASDPLNCGACGWDCAGGSCTDGVCSPVAVIHTKAVTQVASLVDLVFVLNGDENNAKIITYPAEFTSATQPTFFDDGCDATGFITATDKRVYYRPQDPGTCDAAHVLSCGATPPCARTTYADAKAGEHVNGAVAAGSSFFFMVTGEFTIREVELTPDGVPSDMTKAVKVGAMTTPGSGPYHIDYDPSRNALWWTTFGGCVYTIALQDDSSQPSADCFKQAVPNPGMPLITSGGTIYVGSLDGGIREMKPDATKMEMAPLFGSSNTLYLGAIDGDFVFAYDAAPGSLVALAHGTAEERARIPVTDTIGSTDARHPKYVFFTIANGLYRWRKPPPGN